MTIKKLSLATLLLSSSFIFNTHAHNDGFYLGGEFGRSQLKIASTSMNEHANNYGIYAGYRFNHWFALEGKITKTADFHNNTLSTYFETSGENYFRGKYTDNNNEYSATVVSLTPTFYLQFNDTFSAFTKLGISYTQLACHSTETEYTTFTEYFGDSITTEQYDYGTFHTSDDFSGFSYILAVGLDTTLTEHLTVRLSYDYIKSDLKAGSTTWYSSNDSYPYISTDKIDTTLSQISLGVHYNF